MEILKYTLPAFIVFLTTIASFQFFFKKDKQQKLIELRLANRETVTPVKLQAYERLILLLERFSPESLLMRVNTNKKTARELQTELLQMIRAEFDHNLSQQLYVSPQAWEKIVKARGTITQFINITTAKVGEMATAMKLSQKMLEEIIENKNIPTKEALLFLKQEARREFL